MKYGWTGRRLNVDLTSKKVWVEELGQDILESYLGGRGLNAYTLLTRQPDNVEYDSPENPLCFGTGPLTGTNVPGNGRHNVSAKSPLTGIFGDANSGGFFASELKYAGYDQIVVTGKSETPVYITINDGDVQVRDAKHLWGKDVWATEEEIKKEYKDDNIQIASIGQAGENLVRYASVMNNLSRAAGRTGMGAVMGSKMLKAIAVRGTKGIKIAHPEELSKLNKELLRAVYSAHSYRGRSTLGTSLLINVYNNMGILSTNNGRDSIFKDADDISGEKMVEKHQEKNKACFACPVHCSHFNSIKEGKHAGTKGEGVEFETLCSLGSRVGNKDLESILVGNNLCNQYGYDTLSVGSAISFIMECYEHGLVSKDDVDGLDLSWGNSEAILELLHKIAHREGIGDLLAEGVERASAKIPGSEGFVQTIKGMEVPTQDVRGLKGWALAWAVSSRGADHCRAFPLAETLWSKEEVKRVFGTEDAGNRFSHNGKAELVKYYEEISAVGDSLELCRIAQLGCNMPFELIACILHAVTGVEFDEQKLFTIGERIVNTERVYNLKQGMKPSADSLPPRYTDEPIKDGASKGNVVDLKFMLDRYYELRQWSMETGWPDKDVLKRLNIE